MYKADTCIEGQQLPGAETAFSMPAWWYCVRGWLLVQFVYRSSIHAQVRFFARNISEDHLDIPCGEGTLLSIVLLWRKLLGLPLTRISGVDYSHNMVAGAMRRFADRPNFNAQWGDVAHLPFADESFSSANIPNGFHCFPDPDAALRELRRVLKPGGRVAANILLHPRGPRFMRWLPARVNARYIRLGDLNRTFDLAQVLEQARANGFDIRQNRVDGNTLYLVAEKRRNG